MQQPPFAAPTPEGGEGREGRGESPGGGPSPGVGTGGAEPLPSAPPARAAEARQAAGSSASGAEAGAVQSPREHQEATEGLEGRYHPHPYSHPHSPLHQHPFPSPAALGTAPFSRHPPAWQPGALTWKRFFTQIFFMLLQSPAGPVTRTQARQDSSPLPAGSPLSARRGSKRCSEHPSPPAAGNGGGRGRGSPGWALGRAGAVSMKHHWSAPPFILPPPASASASPPALAHSDSGGGQAGHRWRGARATVVEGREGACLRRVHSFSTPGFVYTACRGPSPRQAARLYHCSLSPVHPAPLPRTGVALLRTQPPHYSPHMQTSWDGTTQHSSALRAVPKVLSNRADWAATALHPAGGLQCAMALPSKMQAHQRSASLCSVPHIPQPSVTQKDALAKGVGHSTTVHGKELIWAQCFTSIPLANHTSSSPSAGAKSNLVPCPPGASGPTWVCWAGLLSPVVASLLCG